MQDIKSREVRLVSYPSGIPTAANFTVAETMLEAAKDQEVFHGKNIGKMVVKLG
jgi:hypothetical protein